MVLKRNSVTKLASLSALGAGALVLGAQEADASVILVSVGQTVGFSSTDLASYTSPALGTSGANFKFSRASTNRTTSSGAHIHFRKDLFNRLGTLSFAESGGALELFGAGATFNQKSSAGAAGKVAARFFALNTFSHSVQGNTSFTDKYALIHFGPGAGLYGWIELSLSVTDAFGNGTNGSLGPNLTIVSYAFDTTGAILDAGDTTGGSETPEPATFAMTGLAALALGAAGVRRWRKARQA